MFNVRKIWIAALAVLGYSIITGIIMDLSQKALGISISGGAEERIVYSVLEMLRWVGLYLVLEWLHDNGK